MFSYADTLAEHTYRHTISELRRRAGELAPILARHGVELALQGAEGAPTEPSQAGKLWDSVKPLEKTLSKLEKALSRGKPGGSEGVNRDAAKAAPPDT